jgi:hypothetical protein
MKLRIYVQPADRLPSGRSYFQDFLDSSDNNVPNVGDTVRLNTMSASEVVKARHFRWLDSDSLEVRLDV